MAISLAYGYLIIEPQTSSSVNTTVAKPGYREALPLKSKTLGVENPPPDARPKTFRAPPRTPAPIAHASPTFSACNPLCGFPNLY